MKTYFVTPSQRKTGLLLIEKTQEVQARSFEHACVQAGYTTLYGKKPGCNFKGQQCWRQMEGGVVVSFRDPRKEPECVPN